MNEPDDLGQQLSAFGRRRTAKRRGRSLCAPGGAIRVQVAVHVQLKRPRGSARPILSDQQACLQAMQPLIIRAGDTWPDEDD